MSWLDNFKKKAVCQLCDVKIRSDKAGRIKVECADGLLDMKVCDDCYEVFQTIQHARDEAANDIDDNDEPTSWAGD